MAIPWRVKSRVEAVVRPAARVAGFAGVALLAGCGLLWMTPAPDWPASLEPSHLPIYALISLSVASLLGWTFVEEGQKRIVRRLPRGVALAAFVVLPIAFAILGFVGAARVARFGGPLPSHWIWKLVHWYGPVLVVTNLAVFLAWKSRGRTGRGLAFALLVAPYAVLFAYLVFGVHVAAIDDAHHATMATLGSSAVALQLALAFFVGGGGE